MQFHLEPRLRALCLALAVLGLSACETMPREGKPAPVAEIPLDVRIQDARKLLAANDVAGAQSALQEAARLNPGSARPWQVLAQMHFDAGNYGAAIVASQEVLARDANDTTANNIIAVSGLRSAVAAIAYLRRVDGIHGSARQESEQLAERLRDTLGLPVLVPAPEPVVAKPAPSTRRSTVKPAAPAATATAPAPAKPVAAATPAPAAPAAQSASTAAAPKPAAATAAKPAPAPATAGATSRDPFSSLK